MIWLATYKMIDKENAGGQKLRRHNMFIITTLVQRRGPLQISTFFSLIL